MCVEDFAHTSNPPPSGFAHAHGATLPTSPLPSAPVPGRAGGKGREEGGPGGSAGQASAAPGGRELVYQLTSSRDGLGLDGDCAERAVSLLELRWRPPAPDSEGVGRGVAAAAWPAGG